MALNLTAAAIFTILISEDCDLLQPFTIKDENDVAIDLTGFTVARFIVKEKQTDVAALLDISNSDSSPDSRVEIPDPTDGTINVIINDADTGVLGAAFDTGVYELIFTDGSSPAITDCVAAGEIEIRKSLR